MRRGAFRLCVGDVISRVPFANDKSGRVRWGMVRLKLAARRPVLPTGADSPDYDFAMAEPGPEPGPSGGQSV